MCGFVALMSNEITAEKVQWLTSASDLIAHRGPDDSQFLIDNEIAFAFKRLSFVDVDGGAQPYRTADGRLTCLFNGEIYNHNELRAGLVAEGIDFETHSEIEVIARLYLQQGETFVTKLRGMFAIVIYDHLEKRVLAMRDAFGIKPLYYQQVDDTLFLSSELKVLQPEAGFEKDVLNLDALNHYFTFQYVPEEETAVKGIYHVPVGHLLTYDQNSGIKMVAYQPFKAFTTRTTETVNKHHVKEAIMESVEAHLQAEVPIGTFLSGGIDSTIVASVAKRVNPDILAFSIGYEEQSHSELTDAQKSADALGIHLKTRQVSAREYMDAVRPAIYHMDSPQADPSAIMFYLLSEFAVKDVKACLSGEGADELFGGYPIYKEVDGLRLITSLPEPFKKGLLGFSQLLPEGLKGKNYLVRGATSLKDRYAGNAFIFNENEKRDLLKFTGSDWRVVTNPLYSRLEGLSPLKVMQTIDLQTWLKGDILVKADRLSMAHSLEVCVPFLDDVVFDVARQLTKAQKIKGQTAKAILREAFWDFLPDHIKNMKKRGFPVPLAGWMRGELYEEIKDILQSPVAAPFIRQTYALDLLKEHQTGRRDHARQIWTIVVFVLWLEIYLEKAA